MRGLDDLSLKLKLALLLAACLVLLSGGAALTLWSSARLGGALQSLYADRLPSYGFAAQVDADLRDLNGLINQSMALEAIGFSAKEVEGVDKAIVTVGQRIQTALEGRLAVADADERAQLEAIQASLKKYRKMLADVVDLKSTGVANAATFLTTANSEYASLQKTVSAISARELQQAGEEVAAAQAGSRRMQLLTVTALLGAAVLAIAAGVAITRGMLRRLQRLSRTMAALGDGDLTRSVEPKGSDEIGQLMRDAEAVRERLAASMRSVHAASESVRAAAAEIANGNASLGERTDSASSSLQQTSASIHQLAGAVDENARASERASTTATGAASSARATGDVVAQMVQTMGGISEASKRIAEITGVIDGIAFQTNILALNAAVEAARAGEHGRGFAVVAGEVRNLAQRASSAAKEIATLIQDSVSSVRAGEQLVGKAGSAIEHLMGEVASVADLLASIRAATVQQSTELAQVNGALSSIETATVQNATLVEESTAAALSLREQADSLAQTLGRFRIAAA
ncbi:HAMP domain-containing protein [Ramlibacter sp. USB13]|uniref:HAMP domain-containing protein n=1 Tax=Ramlibacter cellulosilyticus TaxID=2764187 RepID=A0A923MUI0_9BURK|nr:methyl-accepting chemotaxis protein [Ramlibacter cellulosilyticus]MBC5785236.1 HAMP domain-containing protein [Ramlibacter cellulosilyticus]